MLTTMACGALAWPGCSGGGATADAGPTDGAPSVFTPPVDPGPGGILFAASGEVLALSGYGFPPSPADAPAFVDGWQLSFTRLLATFDKIKLSSNPDVDPGNQTLTGPPPGTIGGGVVAEADGPWAVDLAHDGPENLAGKGDPGVKAVPIVALKNQNRNGNRAFGTDGTRYAFGFDIVTATASALNVNLDEAAQADYAAMVQDQCSVLYVGTATFKGGTLPGYSDCNAGHDAWPAPNTPVTFRLCFKSPTTYANCQNADLTGDALTGEDYQRGIPLSTTQSTLAQVTLHTDHPFWDSVLHDSPAHFDQFAARLVGQPVGTAATLEMTKGIDFGAYTDGLGNPVAWRTCVAAPTDVHALFTGPMAFDRESVPRAATAADASGFHDYYDFATYNQSTQGHLNADGLCAVQRHYPSPL
jgi:hypothetical protein